jgi:hypothetical protein
MDFTQHNREEPEAHQKAQLFLLKKYQKEMFSLCIYMENESKLIDKEGLLFDIMKNSKTKIEYFLIIIEKCINFYHFGCEVFLHYVKKFMENEVKSVKDYSDEYTVSLSDLRGRELFTNLHYVLMSFPFTNYVLKSAPSPLHELLKNDYEEVIESLKKYLNIGYALRDELIINKLKFELPKLRADSDIAYYAAIIGPSFMGKTQTAFTLSHCMTVLYINLPIGSRKEVQLKINQDIYKAFFSFSTILNRIIAEDLHELELTGEDFNASDFYNEAHQIMPFKILGLIFSLIKLKMLRADINIFEWYKSIVDIERVWIPSMTIETFLNAIRGKIFTQIIIFINMIYFRFKHKS